MKPDDSTVRILNVRYILTMSAFQKSWQSSRYSWGEVESINVSPFVLYRGKVSNRYGAYTHPYYTWWWLITGSVRLDTPGQSLHLRKGHWVFIPSSTRRIQTFSEDAHIISVNFFANWPNGLPLLAVSQPIVGSARFCPDLRRQAEEICTVLEQNNRGKTHFSRMNLTISEVFSVKSGLYEFIDTLFRSVARRGASITKTHEEDPRLATILNWLHTNLQIGPLPFIEWRQQTGLGRSQIENLARKYLRMSLVSYRNRLLTAEACRRLGIHSVQVKQVAEELGFVDSSHFCKWLRQHTGRTPANFRNQDT